MTLTPLKLTALAEYFTGNGFQDFTAPVGTFGPVPPGYIWTGTISACISQQLTSGSRSQTPLGAPSRNDALAGVVWTLYRNGQAEMTWVGLSALCNVQAFGNDLLQVSGQVPAIGLPINAPTFDTGPPLPVTFNFTGYAGTEAEVLLTVPFVSTSVQSVPGQGMSYPSQEISALSALVQATGTTVLLASPQPEPFQLWRMSLDLSVSTGGTAKADCSIQDGLGTVYARGSVVASGTASVFGNATTAHDLDLAGIWLEAAQAPMTFVVNGTFTGTGNQIRASCVLYYCLSLVV